MYVQATYRLLQTKKPPCYHNKGDLADFSQFAYEYYQNIFNTAVLSNF